MINFDANLLLGYYQARAGVGAGTVVSGAGKGDGGKAPTPPWSSLSKDAKPDELLKGVLMGRKFVNESQTQLDVRGASEDYRQLFSMHTGLATLEALAKRADEKDIASSELKRLQTAFARGVDELSAYIDQAKFEKLRLTHGDAVDRARMTVGVPRTNPKYVTAPLHDGAETEAVQAFQGDVKFSVKVKLPNNTETTLDFDLAEMGGTTRTMSNVVKYLNDKLATTPFTTRFAVERIKGEDKTVEVNGRQVVVAKAKDQFALKIQGDATEKLTFSAPTTAPAVYLTQTAGDPDPDGKATTDDGVLQQEFLKFETGAATEAVRRPGDTNWTDGRVFSEKLPDGVASVRTQVTGPDGSIYMLVDVDGEVDGQTIKGSTDVALMKMDGAGNVVYTRTLGASDNAKGLALTVAADGKVAIAGSVTGGFAAAGVPIIEGDPSTIPDVRAADDGLDPAKSDSFVMVFDAEGQEMWSQRQGARDEDEATGVAFAADGSVYVMGRSKASMPGATSSGGWDSYMRAFTDEGRLKSTTQFGTSGDDKPVGLVVDGGHVVVASLEGGNAVLRRYDVSNPAAPTLAATRNLGGLGGGTLAGIALDGGNIVLAGSTGAALSFGTVTRAASGGVDAFGATISADLSAGASDRIAYYGGAGDERVTGMTIAGGKVWLTGTTKTGLPGMPDAVGELDGYAVELDVAAGATGWSQRFTAKDEMAAPTSISVDMTGASALDRLGLPRGEMDYADSTLITSATSARPGDQFQIRTRPGARPVTITIEADDTLDTLATKIRRATTFSIKVDVVSDGTAKRLQIMPKNDRSTVEILGGKGGLDALEALGLPEGYVRKNKMEDGELKPADGGLPIYGLKLARDLSIASKSDIKTTLDELSLAMSTIRTAYRELKEGLEPQTKAKPAGQVPAYLKSQIANYQAALDRLGG